MSEAFPTHYTKPQGANEPDPLMRDRKFHSIVPRTTVAGTALVLVIAIMSFLSSLTLGAVSLVSDTARGWQNEIAREVTIQVRPVEGQEMAQQVEAASQLASSFEGISGVTVVDSEAMGRLLAPWLGNGLDLDELPVPQLITLELDKNQRPDLAALGAKLAQTVPGASLDDHRAWLDRLTTMARATVLIGVMIFIMIMAATILTVVFATRGAMAGNRNVIEVLHFVGAEQGYIAAEFQKHFLFLGLKGAVSGGLTALACFVAVGLWSAHNIADPASDQVAALFGTFSIGVNGYIGTLVLIFVIALLTALTSRFTVLRHVGTLDRSGREE